MKELQIFNNEQFGEIRALTIENQPWFVGKDITEKLGYQNSSKALIDHVDEEDKLNNESLSSLGQRGGWLINESGLYSLVLGSKLENAKRFKKWVTNEVLPSIRKNGMYAVDELLDNPDLLIQTATRLKEERQARLEAEKKVQVLKPKAEFYDDVAGSKDSIEMGHVAKVIGIKGVGRNKLFEILRSNKVLDRNNIPYQTFVDRGYFRVLEQKYTVPNGETKVNIKTMVFQKGVDYIRKIVKGE